MQTHATDAKERTAPPITVRQEIDEYGKLTGYDYVKCQACGREAMAEDDLRHRETCPWRADDEH